VKNTFGDETFWTDTLQMNKMIEPAVDPLTAASVGLKIDAAALPPVVKGVTDGSIPLDDPQTTLALLSLNAVVGVQGQVSKGAEGALRQPAHLVVDRVRPARLEYGASLDVILQVLAHRRQGVANGDARTLQIVGVANPRQLQEVGRVDRPGTDNHLALASRKP